MKLKRQAATRTAKMYSVRSAVVVAAAVALALAADPSLDWIWSETTVLYLIILLSFHCLFY